MSDLATKIITLEAYAKINLTLDVIGRRADGYHEIDSIMQTVKLHDVVTVELNDDYEKRITISCDKDYIPCDSSNIAYKCAKGLLDYCGSQRGCHIHIKKRIPMNAGLAGGSTDGAATLRAINFLLQLGMNRKELMKFGAQFGADIPFCLYTGLAACTGIGDEVIPLPRSKTIDVAIIKPNFGISTPEAYKLFDTKNIQSARATKHMLKEIMVGRPYYQFISNDLERALDNQEIKKLKAELIKRGAFAAEMTGSGSAVYGLFTDGKKSANAAFDYIADYDAHFTETL